MEINESLYKGASFITLKNATGLELELCNLGASIYKIKLNGDVMTMTLKNKDDFFKVENYHGKTLGRVGNRIKNGTFTIDDKVYKLKANEGKTTTLHGGVEPISNAMFAYTIVRGEQFSSVIFQYLSKDGESGFPANLDLRISFILYENKNEFHIEYHALADATTPCSITNHTFFTLGEDSVDKLKLQIKASRFLHPNPDDLIAEEIRPVTPVMDFRKEKVIGRDIHDEYLQNSKTIGYDHHYYFDVTNDPFIPLVTLSSDRYQMKIYTDHTGVQIYTDNYPSPYEMIGLPTKVPNRSVAIEPQEDHLNIHLLTKNKLYMYFIRYVFEEK